MSSFSVTSFGLPRIFRKSKEPQPRSPLPQLKIDVKGHKAQHILGISAKELSAVRSQSLSSSSTARPLDSSISNATTAPVASPLAQDEAATSPASPHLKSTSSSTVLPDDIDNESTKDPGAGSHLSSFPSSSTLHSHYDRSKTPLSISQQTSDSSSRDFALRKGTSPVVPRSSQEMEHAVQMLFIKSSKSRPKETKKVSTPNIGQTRESAALQINGVHIPRHSGGKVKLNSPSSRSLPLNSVPLTPNRKISPMLRRSESAQNPPIASSDFVVRDPYAKINVRRPKAGAKHWFDEVDGLSEEEPNEEPMAGPNFVNQVERAFANPVSATNSPPDTGSVPVLSFPPRPEQVRKTPKSTVPYRVIIPPGSARALLTEHKPLTRKTSLHDARSSHKDPVQSHPLPKQSNALAAADLSKQSILCLSSSDDEDETDLPELLEAPTPKTKIRESLSDTIVDESDIEVGLAKTVKANSGEPIVRAAHARPETLRLPPDRPSPLEVSTRATSRHASYLMDPSTENDMTESDIITSFPATPSDTGSLRTSIRSSIFSDNGSLASTRPMLVTKQEEKLLAAMRRKKAAMRQAERETDRDGALRVLESAGQTPAGSTQQSRSYASEQAKLDHRLSNRYRPTRSQAHHHSLRGSEPPISATYARESGTSFETSIYSQRNSQATIRTIFSEDSDSTHSAYPRSDATVMSPARRHFQNPAARGRRVHRRDTYHSSTSTTSSNRRNSHVVMLDGLDEALSREHVPSQLFMEAPFIGWERAGLTSTR